MAHDTLTTTFHLTHNCNIRCSYCFTGEKFGAGMTAAIADRAVDFALGLARERGFPRLDVVFFGGEPLLRRDLLLRIADDFRARAGGIEVAFKTSTNGLLLTAETLDALVERGVFVSLSIDGVPEIQDRQRPDAAGHGTSERLAAVVPRLLRAIPAASANCVVTPQSAGRLDESVAWLFRQGFFYVTTALDHGNAGWTRESLSELEAAYERLAAWYEIQMRAGRKFYLGCIDERIRTRTWGPPEPAEQCLPGVRSFSIAPSGRIYPCVQFVREDESDEFVMGDVFAGLRAGADPLGTCSAKDREECGDCALKPRCSSWCACVNWQSTVRLDRVSPLVCEHERLLFPIVDRAANRLWKARNAFFLHKQYNRDFPLVNFVEEVVLNEAMHGSPVGGIR